MVGAVLNGKWKLTKLLGMGGMGAVFAAQNVHNDTLAAVKILHPEFNHEQQILHRFLAEAQTAQRLRHPNITEVYEYAQAEDGSPYLVMELLQGTSLADYMDGGTPIEVHEASPIIYQVLQALVAAHAQGVVHRDIKPDNVFLVDDTEGRVIVKVLDFGIAKVMDVAGGMGSKTRTGVLLGTPGFMSPEQIKNSKAVDPRSDLWSVGAIFYEMLTAKGPFEAPTEFAQLTAVLTQDPIPIAKVAPHLAGWQGFFDRALARDLSNRFPTAVAMAQALVQAARTLSGKQPGSAVGVEVSSAPGASQATLEFDGMEGATRVLPRVDDASVYGPVSQISHQLSTLADPLQPIAPSSQPASQIAAGSVLSTASGSGAGVATMPVAQHAVSQVPQHAPSQLPYRGASQIPPSSVGPSTDRVQAYAQSAALASTTMQSSPVSHPYALQTPNSRVVSGLRGMDPIFLLVFGLVCFVIGLVVGGVGVHLVSFMV